MTSYTEKKKKTSFLPLVRGHAVVLWEDAPGQPGEKQTTNDSSIDPQHGRYQQDGSSTQGWKKQRPVIENWIKEKNPKINQQPYRDRQLWFDH